MNTLQQFSKNRTAQLAHKAERGISFIPILLGLVIVALFTVVVVNQYNDSVRTTRIEGAKSEITTIISNAQRSYGAARQFAAVTTPMAINGNIIPANMRVGAGAQNVYDQAVLLVAQTCAVAGDCLRLTYPTAPGDCQEVVLAALPFTRLITVGTTVVRPLDGAINMASLNTACNVAAAASVNVLLDFGFR